MAQVDRGAGGWRCAASHAGAVSRGALRGCAAGRLDRPAEAVAAAAVPCGCAGRGSGVRAGWRWVCGRSSGSSGSGPSGWRRAARARVGISCRSCLRPSGCCRRAASGGRIANGSSRVRWPTCWARTPGLRSCASSIAVTTGCFRTRRRCSRTWCGAGGTCSTPPSTCCCTI